MKCWGDVNREKTEESFWNCSDWLVQGHRGNSQLVSCSGSTPVTSCPKCFMWLRWQRWREAICCFLKERKKFNKYYNRFKRQVWIISYKKKWWLKMICRILWLVSRVNFFVCLAGIPSATKQKWWKILWTRCGRLLKFLSGRCVMETMTGTGDVGISQTNMSLTMFTARLSEWKKWFLGIVYIWHIPRNSETINTVNKKKNWKCFFISWCLWRCNFAF